MQVRVREGHCVVGGLGALDSYFGFSAVGGLHSISYCRRLATNTAIQIQTPLSLLCVKGGLHEHTQNLNQFEMNSVIKSK